MTADVLVMDAQLVYDARRKCTGATVHAVDQIILTLPMLIHVHNKRPTDETLTKIHDLQRLLHALAYR